MADRRWYRRQNETPDEYALFCKYRDAEPKQRSISKLAKKLKIPEKRLYELSAKFRWLERARGFDMHNEEKAAQRLQRRQNDLVESENDLLNKLHDKVEAAIDHYNPMKVENIDEIPDPENEGQMMRIVTRALNIGDLQKLMKITGDLLRLKRVNAGMPASITAKHVDGGGGLIGNVNRLEIRYEKSTNNDGFIPSNFDEVRVVKGEARKILAEIPDSRA